MRAVISADWHIDKDNRFEDMVGSLTKLADKVIEIKPRYFVFVGDGFKNWRPTPMEMKLFRDTVLKIAESEVRVLIVVGNHDYPESMEYQGKHCFTEFKDWNVHNGGHDNIMVIDKPTGISDFSKKVSVIVIPHLSKSSIEKSYEDTFRIILDEDVERVDKNKKVVLFSHVYLKEATIGAGDMVINNDKGVSVEVLRKAGIDYAFIGDIHKAQRLDPNYYYPGSIERIDFGERGDTKGMIVYDDETDKVEFIELNARQLEEVVIDLVMPGFIKEAIKNVVDESRQIPVADIDDYVHTLITDKKDQLKDAIVKIKVICTKEQKAIMDDMEEKIVKYLTNKIKINKLHSISYELVDSVSVRNAEINESLSPKESFYRWIDMQSYQDDIKQHIRLAGEELLKKGNL